MLVKSINYNLNLVGKDFLKSILFMGLALFFYIYFTANETVGMVLMAASAAIAALLIVKGLNKVFNQETFGDGAYITMTVPMTARQLIISKISICGTWIWIVYLMMFCMVVIGGGQTLGEYLHSVVVALALNGFSQLETGIIIGFYPITQLAIAVGFCLVQYWMVFIINVFASKKKPYLSAMITIITIAAYGYVAWKSLTIISFIEQINLNMWILIGMQAGIFIICWIFYGFCKGCLERNYNLH